MLQYWLHLLTGSVIAKYLFYLVVFILPTYFPVIKTILGERFEQSDWRSAKDVVFQ